MDPKELAELLAKAEANYVTVSQNCEVLQEKLDKVSAESKTEIKLMVEEHKTAMSDLKNEMADLELKMSNNNSPVIKTKEHVDLLRVCVKSAIGKFLKANSDRDTATAGFDEKSIGQKLDYFIKMETKALNLTTTGEGLESIDEVLSREIIERAREAYPILNAVRTRNMPRSLREEVLISYPSVQEGIENVAGANIAETETQQYAEVKNRVAKINAKPRITDEALVGSDLDLYGQLLVLLDDEIGRRLVNQVMFGNGTGKNMRGILSSNRFDITNLTGESFKVTIDAVSPRDPDFYPAITSGVSASFGATSDAILAFILEFETVLPTKYLGTAKWYMNRKTRKVLKLVKDTQGRPLFMDGYMGEPMSLNGYPVVLDDTMPDIAADAPCLIFGDLQQAFSMSAGDIDKMLVDPYTVDGCVVVKIDKEYFEMVGKNDAILVGATSTNAPA